MQELDAVVKAPHKHNTIHTGTGFFTPYIIPAQKDLQKAADILNEGKKVAILVGAGAKNATDEIIAV